MATAADAPVPRLAIAVDGSRVAELLGALTLLRAAGVGGVLVDAGGPVSGEIEAGLRRLSTDAGTMRLVLASAPRLASDLGADLLLAEAGMAAAEARRQIAPGALLGREVASAAAAGLAGGLDFLVAAWSDAAVQSGAFRSIVESAACPVVWRVADPHGGGRVFAAGGEGVILPWRGASETATTASRVGEALPPLAVGRQTVLIDGDEVVLVPDSSVADLLTDLGLLPARVTRNGVALPRRAWDETLLEPGDVIETAN